MTAPGHEAAAYQTGFATGYSAGYAAAARHPQSCSIDVARVAPALSNGLLDARRTQRLLAPTGCRHWVPAVVPEVPPRSPPPHALHMSSA